MANDGKATTDIMLNGAISLGSDEERKLLIEHIAAIRGTRARQRQQRLELMLLCKKLEDSKLWRLYGTWTFARVLHEECGVKHAEYEVYRTAREYIDHETAKLLGMAALREMRRVLRTVKEDCLANTAETLVTMVKRRVEGFTAEHGFGPTKKAAVAIVRAEADRMGVCVTGASNDGLKSRYRWLVSTMEQIESLSDEGSAVGVLARNALNRVRGRDGESDASRKASASAA